MTCRLNLLPVPEYQEGQIFYYLILKWRKLDVSISWVLQGGSSVKTTLGTDEKKNNPDMIVLLRSPTHENEIKKTLAKCSAFLNSLQKKMRIY